MTSLNSSVAGKTSSGFGITFIYCHGELSTNLSTGVTNDEFGLKHPEAHTMLLSIYSKLRMDNVTHIVVLDTEDTDVYIQAAYVSSREYVRT